MEPTIYKPSIYKGAGIYKNGAGGGGDNGFKLFTDFSQYDENERMDYPIIGAANNPIDSLYTTTKQKYGIKIIAPNNDLVAASNPYEFDIDYKKICLSFGISKPKQPPFTNSLIWLNKRGVCLSYRGNLEVLFFNTLNVDTPLTLDENTGTLSRYYTGLTTNDKISAVMQQIENGEYIEVYINYIYCGRFLKSLINDTYDYVNFSPRWESELDIYSLYVR